MTLDLVSGISKAEWISFVAIGSVLLMSIVNAVKSLRSWRVFRQHRPMEECVSPPSLYVSLLGHMMVFLIPVAFVVLEKKLSWLPIVLVLTNTVYWTISALTLIGLRFEKEAPVQVPIFHAIYLLETLTPAILSTSKLGFSRIYVDSLYAKLYLTHAVFALMILTIEALGWTRPQPIDSSFGTFVQRTQSIIAYMWPRKWMVRLKILACFGVIVAGRAINLVVPLYSKWIVDALSGSNPRFCYDLIIVAMFLKFLQGSGAMGGFLNTVRTLLWLGVQQYTTLSIESDVFRHLHRLPLKWHLQRKSGELMKIIDRGTTSINDFLSYLLFNIGPTIADILFAIVFFVFTFNILFGVLVLVTMTFYMGLTLYLTQWRIKYRREMNAADNNAGAIAMDSLLNYETVKYYGNEELEYVRYKGALADYQYKERKSVYSLQLLNAIQNFILGASMIIGSLMMAYNIAKPGSGLSAGDYVLFSTYMIQLSVPLNFLGTVYNVLQRTFTDMENMFSLLNEPSEEKDAGSGEGIKNEMPLIFKNVSFSYMPERQILRNVSFTVPPNKVVAIVGPSGSGKSTIIRLIYRLYNVDSGNISIGTANYKDLTLQSVRSLMGVVPQDTVLFNDTIAYNIRYGRPSATFEEVEHAAKSADLHGFITSHPNRYDCMVGERGLKLSGGEKQRVAIARTLLKNPKFILLDEATSSLDARTEKIVQASLSKLCRKKTVLVVAHRLSTIVNADLILVLNKGEIAESGTHNELLRLNGMYSQMWRIQSEGPHSSKASTPES
ncbi:hypothetical protein M3Y97_01058500 [Aphelenchoides bicaudatus]|nr:hypothetical protein M3Y97_01058500 [Aphelenchoides bicaudatus]